MIVKEQHQTISIPLKEVVLKGTLHIPENPTGLIVFSHGSGSSRLSPRNNYVAKVLQDNGMGTLLFDLLTKKEDEVYENRFDIDLLTNRLITTTQWLLAQNDFKKLPMAYFGASTGAASALRAAAYFGDGIKAVVCRGGRPDMAARYLDQVTAPTLLIVGGWDPVVLELNQKAYEQLRCKRKLEVIPEAGHLFGEPGKLEAVAQTSAVWLEWWLTTKTKENVQG